MKKFLIYSILLHIVLLSFAFLKIQDEKKKEPAPFYTRIITPEELQEERISRIPRLPENLPPPKSLSSIPKSPYAKKRAQKVSPQKHLDSKDGVDSQTRERASEKSYKERPGSLSPRSSSDTAHKQEETGTAPGLQGTPGRGTEGREGPSAKTAREKIFDKDIIAKSFGKGKEKTKPDNAITFDTKEFKYYGYMQRLRDKVEGTWRYPPEAADKEIYGDLYIRFTIKRNGRLGAVELVRTSGYKMLDDAAIKALRDADPYWPLPDDWAEDGLTITGHFVYSLYGAYIR